MIKTTISPTAGSKGTKVTYTITGLPPESEGDLLFGGLEVTRYHADQTGTAKGQFTVPPFKPDTYRVYVGLPPEISSFFTVTEKLSPPGVPKPPIFLPRYRATKGI